MNCNSENASKRPTFHQIWQNLSQGVKTGRKWTPSYRTVKFPYNTTKKAKSTILLYAKHKVLTAMLWKIQVFWVVTPCQLVTILQLTW